MSTHETSLARTPKDFLALVAAYPNYPIVAMVDGDVCGGDRGTFAGEFGSAYICKIWIGERQAYYHDPTEYEDDVVFDPGCAFDGDKDTLSANELQALYDALPWQDSIVVHINPISSH